MAVLCPRDGGGRDAASLGEGREMERGHARPLQPPWMTEWKWAAAAEGDVVAVLCPREPSSLTVARCFHSYRTIVGQARRRRRGGRRRHPVTTGEGLTVGGARPSFGDASNSSLAPGPGGSSELEGEPRGRDRPSSARSGGLVPPARVPQRGPRRSSPARYPRTGAGAGGGSAVLGEAGRCPVLVFSMLQFLS